MVKKNGLLVLLLSSAAMSVHAAGKHNQLGAKLDEIAALDRDIVQLLEQNSTSPRQFEDRVVTLAHGEPEQSELFEKENYRRESHRERKKKRKKVGDKVVEVAAADEKKKHFVIAQGDYKLEIGGSAKVEHYVQKNATLLNRNIPDEFEYFKHATDLNFDFSFGEKEFEHKAVEAYAYLYHKGYWGKGSVFADSPSNAPALISIGDATLGNHTHQNGRPLVWFREAWMCFSLNAIAQKKGSQDIHYLQLGWFPFTLGRGISLGLLFGGNQGALGLYNYIEEKYAPGINLSGSFFKDHLAYDLYYSKFEERGKNLADTAAAVNTNQPGAASWRGVGKDNDLFAARIKWKPFEDESPAGVLELEPYILVNQASDQKVEALADGTTNLRTAGLAVEHSYKDFEWGGEAAFNFGKIKVHALDRNNIEIKRGADGRLQETYDYVVQADAMGAATANAAVVTDVNKALVQVNRTNLPNPGAPGGIVSKNGRFRDAYDNNLKGWMALADAAYNFKKIDTKIAVGGGYVSGDEDPNRQEVNGDFKGFIGVNEIYSGKHVKSILVLDERTIRRPVIRENAASELDVDAEIAFTNLKFVGASLLWKPKVWKKQLSFNPNCIFFWSAHTEKKPTIDATTGKATIDPTAANARNFMGTELNLCSNIEMLKDLNLYINLAMFIPGGFFTDLAGLPIGKDEFTKVARNDADALGNAIDPLQFRLKDHTAYHMNIGITCKF